MMVRQSQEAWSLSVLVFTVFVLFVTAFIRAELAP